VETAKRRAAGNTRWINAIDKAVDGLLGNAWIVTELVEGLLITTESGETYHANGACQCKAYENGQACKHRAAARLVQMMNEKEEAPAASLPAVTAGESTCPVCKRHWVVTPSDDCLLPACGCFGSDTSPANPTRPCESCGMAHAFNCSKRQGGDSLPGEEITRQEMQARATDAQRRRIETLTTALRC